MTILYNITIKTKGFIVRNIIYLSLVLLFIGCSAQKNNSMNEIANLQNNKKNYTHDSCTNFSFISQKKTMQLINILHSLFWDNYRLWSFCACPYPKKYPTAAGITQLSVSSTQLTTPI